MDNKELTKKLIGHIDSLSNEVLKYALTNYIETLSSKEFAEFCTKMLGKKITYLGDNEYGIAKYKEN